MAIIGLQKGSRKWLKVGEKSGNFEMDIKWQTWLTYPALQILLEVTKKMLKSKCFLVLQSCRSVDLKKEQQKTSEYDQEMQQSQIIVHPMEQ